MNDREWEDYIQDFCYREGKNVKVGFKLLEKQVSVHKLMDYVQKKSRGENMSNKITVETVAKVESGNAVNLATRGTFDVYFTKRSEIGRVLDVKNKEKFKVTVERI